MKKPHLLLSGFLGFVLAFPVVALFYLAWKLARLPFVVFDLFDWLSRHLPGPIITKSIETMVSIIRVFNLGPTADVAKTAEKTMAVIIFLVGGFVAAILIRLVLRWLGQKELWPAMLSGGLVGLPLLLISLDRGKVLQAGVLASGLWILLVFLSWGYALGWVFLRVEEEPSENTGSWIPGRRRFIRLVIGIAAGVTLVGTAAGALVRRRKETASSARWSSDHSLPNTGSAVKPAPGTRPEFTPLEDHYRIDIDTMPPHIHLDDWRLSVSGLVAKDIDMTMAEIRKYKPLNQFITLECISNYIAGDLISTTRWTGVSLVDLLPVFRLKPGATHFKMTAADGFSEFISIREIQKDKRVMLCYDWDGVPLPGSHGFPLRIYIPDRYGMKQPKWIVSLEAVNHNGEGYWVKRGWDREAHIRATSVIDTVAVDHVYVDDEGTRRVPAGGIAFAGARGISGVELKVDDGRWMKARLRPPLSGTTWVIWRYDVPYEKGKHRFTVRCFEGDGTPQIETRSKPHPSGATGLHSIVVSM